MIQTLIISSEEQENQKVPLIPVEKLLPEIKPDLDTPKLTPEARESDKDGEFICTGHSFDTAFLDRLLKLINDKAHGEFYTNFVAGARKKITGQILVDLGAGNTNLGYSLSLLLGAAKYVGVEKFAKTVKELEKQLSQINIKSGKISLDNPAVYDGRKSLKEQKIVTVDKLIPASVVQDKMLHFLRRLPDNSVSILTSGIHDQLIDNPDYRAAIAVEIERVLHPKGAYISNCSDINTKNLSLMPDLSNKNLDIKVFIKK